MRAPSSLLAVAVVVLSACGGGPTRPTRAVPDATGGYDLRVDRVVPVGASWDELAEWESEELQTTQVLDQSETTTRRRRIELSGRVTRTSETQLTIVVTTLVVDDGTGSGPRPLLAAGETLVVTQGEPGTITGPRGPFSEDDDELLREIIHTSSSDSGHDDAAEAFGPPGGIVHVGETWTLDHEALAAIFRGSRNGIRVRPEDVEGTGRLESAPAWEGHDNLRIGLALAVHHFDMDLPPGATVEDIELRMAGEASWPLDLNVPSGGDSLQMETHIAMTVAVPEAPGVVAHVAMQVVEVERRTRSGYRAP